MFMQGFLRSRMSLMMARSSFEAVLLNGTDIVSRRHQRPGLI